MRQTKGRPYAFPTTNVNSNRATVVSGQCVLSVFPVEFWVCCLDSSLLSTLFWFHPLGLKKSQLKSAQGKSQPEDLGSWAPVDTEAPGQAVSFLLVCSLHPQKSNNHPCPFSFPPAHSPGETEAWQLSRCFQKESATPLMGTQARRALHCRVSTCWPLPTPTRGVTSSLAPPHLGLAAFSSLCTKYSHLKLPTLSPSAPY